MYTSEQLKEKSLPELKDIGWQLNALPDGDRRLRRNWIRAIEATQQVTETSPGVEVDPVQEPIIETVETSPAASVEQVSEAIAPAAETPRRAVVASEPIGSDYWDEVCRRREEEEEWEGYWGDLYPEDEDEEEDERIKGCVLKVNFYPCLPKTTQFVHLTQLIGQQTISAFLANHG